nr:immunoglobulin light chain junction region [Macaca mulatta]MOW58136.1 immunoglobulin light chain junction region [Macaca mulatta]MOW58619.1 immunoglobulin light chain junction region [Macaca mulatta]MOW59602.1 immunoglobulin light chain junction region [Macaca mulatta]
DYYCCSYRSGSTVLF